MGILSRLRGNKNKLVQPAIVVEDDFESIELLAKASYEEGRSYYSVWRPNPQSPTGRSYRVQVYGEMGTVEGGGNTLAMAIKEANKKYDKKAK